jgi:hypothetical protein
MAGVITAGTGIAEIVAGIAATGVAPTAVIAAARSAVIGGDATRIAARGQTVVVPKAARVVAGVATA